MHRIDQGSVHGNRKLFTYPLSPLRRRLEAKGGLRPPAVMDPLGGCDLSHLPSPLFPVVCPLSPTPCPLSFAPCPLPPVPRLQPWVPCPLSPAPFPLSSVLCLSVPYPLSNVLCPSSPVPRFLSSVPCPLTPVPRPLSRTVPYPLSPVPCPLSSDTRESLSRSAYDGRPRPLSFL